MADAAAAPQTLILDLVEWAAARPRTYAEFLDSWRTSCPRLTVWEDAVDLGYVAREFREGRGTVVTVTAAGRAFLREHGRHAG